MPCTPAGTADEACARKFAAAIRPPRLAAAAHRGRDRHQRGHRVDSATCSATSTRASSSGLRRCCSRRTSFTAPASGEPDPTRHGKRPLHELRDGLAAQLLPVEQPARRGAARRRRARACSPAIAGSASRPSGCSPRRGRRRGLRNFVTEWLGLDGLDTSPRTRPSSPITAPRSAPAAREETLRGFEHLVFEAGRRLPRHPHDAQTFVNPKLASMYAVAAPEADGLRRGRRCPTDRRAAGCSARSASSRSTRTPPAPRPRCAASSCARCCSAGHPAAAGRREHGARPSPEDGRDAARAGRRCTSPSPLCAGCHQVHGSHRPRARELRRPRPLPRHRERRDHRRQRRARRHHVRGRGDLARRRSTITRSSSACFVKKLYEYATSFVEQADEQESSTRLSNDSPRPATA